jgi:hypothetical protein
LSACLGREVRLCWVAMFGGLSPLRGPLAAGAAERKNSETRLGDARGTRRSNRPYRAHHAPRCDPKSPRSNAGGRRPDRVISERLFLIRLCRRSGAASRVLSGVLPALTQPERLAPRSSWTRPVPRPSARGPSRSMGGLRTPDRHGGLAMLVDAPRQHAAAAAVANVDAVRGRFKRALRLTRLASRRDE